MRVLEENSRHTGEPKIFRPEALRRFSTIWKIWRMLSAKILKYTEYDSFEELNEDYSHLNIKDLEGFEEMTTVIEIENTRGIIIRDF